MDVSSVSITMRWFMITMTHVSMPVVVNRDSVMVMLNVHVTNIMIFLMVVLYFVVRHFFNDDIMPEVVKGCVPSVLFADDMFASSMMLCHWGRLRHNYRIMLYMWRRVMNRWLSRLGMRMLMVYDWLVMEAIIVMLFVNVPVPVCRAVVKLWMMLNIVIDGAVTINVDNSWFIDVDDWFFYVDYRFINNVMLFYYVMIFDRMIVIGIYIILMVSNMLTTVKNSMAMIMHRNVVCMIVLIIEIANCMMMLITVVLVSSLGISCKGIVPNNIECWVMILV